MWFDEALIAAVRENEILFDMTNSNFKRTDIKDEIWKQIAAKLQSTDDKCRSRWRNLRDSFKKIHKARSFPPGPGNALPRIKWKYYNHLKFLEDFKCSHQNTNEQDIGDPLNNVSGAITFGSPNAAWSESNDAKVFEYLPTVSPTTSASGAKSKTQATPQISSRRLSAWSESNDAKVFEYLPTVSPTTSASGAKSKTQATPQISSRRLSADDENLNERFSTFLASAEQAIEKFREESTTVKFFTALAAKIDEANLPPLIVSNLESRITTLVYETIAQHIAKQNNQEFK